MTGREVSGRAEQERMVMSMDQETVERLEEEIEEAIAWVVRRTGRKRLPLLPSRRTMHLMAKAAVAVYEAVAVDGHQQEG
jgi:hypothetical protein